MGHLFLGSKQDNNEKSMSSSPFIDKIHKHYKTGAQSTSSTNKSENNTTEMAAPNMTTREDERGFVKTEKFVDRNPCPNGFQLVDPAKSGKKNQYDLVELAANIQKADEFTRATAGSKLSVIAEQVRFLQQQ